MRKWKSLAIIVTIILTLTACGGNSSQGEQNSYEATKKMVVDILKTDDGKKAIIEVLTDKKMKQQVVLDSEIVKTSIEETVSSEKGQKFWEKLFQNPQFSKTFAESLTEEQKKIMKDLMKDSQYQKSMIEILQNPEMTQQMLTVVKSQQFKEHLEKTIQETMDTPLFKAKMSEIVMKAAEEMKTSGGGKKEEGQSGGEGNKSGSQGSKGQGESGGGGEE